MPTANINGVDIAYTDQGSGTPIVFIHGYPLDKRMWDPQVAALSSTARVITLDLRGHGESQPLFWLTSVDTYADDVRGVLDHVGVDKAVIVGFSMGGYVAFAFLRKYPERVRGLVLADTRAQPDSDEAKQARYQSAVTVQTRGHEPILEAMLPRLVTQATIDEKPEVVEKVKTIMRTTTIQGYAGDLMAMATRPDSVDMLASIKVPTLVLVGDQDGLTPPADAELMAQRIPGATLTVITGAAHASNMEQPDAFNKAISDFLHRV